MNTDGYRKYICDSRGDVKLTEAYCDAEHRSGDSWTTSDSTSIRTFTCGPSGGITESIACVSNPLHSMTASGACVPARCGATLHGASSSIGPIENGKIIGHCEYGTMIEDKKDCYAGFKLGSGSCQAYVPPKITVITKFGSK